MYSQVCLNILCLIYCTFKVALSFPIKIVLRKLHTYIITNASYESICVEFEIKQTHHWLFYFQIASKFLKSFMTDPINIIFEDFGKI